jgi:hypothetical protein
MLFTQAAKLEPRFCSCDYRPFLATPKLRFPCSFVTTALPVPRTMDFSNKNSFESPSPLPDSNHFRTRNAMAATTACLDITLDFASRTDNFPPLDQLEMFMLLVSSLCYRLVKFPSWDAILQFRHNNKDVSLLGHPFLINLNKAEVLAVR